MKTAMSLVMVLAFSSGLWAASISFVIGDAQVRVKGRWQNAATGPLAKNAKAIRTGKKSLAIIALNEKTTIKLKADSELVFEQLNKKKMALFLKRGGVFSRILKGGKSSYYLRTSTATAAVRGTEFFMAYGEKGLRGQEVWLCVNEGKVAVTGKSKVHPVMVAAGLGIYVDTDGDITPPRRFEWTKRLNWNTDPDRGSVEDKTDIIDTYRKMFDDDDYP